MIRRAASAALLVRDGFTGRTLPDGSGTRCELDGSPFRPVWKPDGYLVLTDLAPGGHTLRLARLGYLEEEVRLDIREGRFREGTVSLKPGPGYRFPPGTAAIELTFTGGEDNAPAAGAELWAGMSGRTPLKLAQDKSRKPSASIRVFYSGPAALYPVPGWFLLADAAAPELAFLRAMREGEAELAEPMASAHPRGTELVPVQPYTVGTGGRLRLLFRQAGTASLFCRGIWKKTELQPGEQALEWKV